MFRKEEIKFLGGNQYHHKKLGRITLRKGQTLDQLVEELGPQMNWDNFKGTAKRIEDIDLPRLGYKAGVGEDEMHMIIDVEAAGSGFDSKGRPKMLFEPHVFYRNLPVAKRAGAVKAGLAYAKWRPGNYPADSYPRLEAALAIDETAALKAASWGMGQILGENFRMLNYDSPQEMVRAFMADEDKQLEGMVDFIISANIDDELQALSRLKRKTLPSDTAPFVRVYNGPGYKANRYDVKAANAHNFWRGIKDTPWNPEDVGPDTKPPEETSFPVLRPGAKSAVLVPFVKILQERLRVHGYNVSVDGDFGPKTKAAVVAFQEKRGLKPDGVIGNNETWPALLSDPV